MEQASVIDAGPHFAQQAAEVIADVINRNIAERGECIVGLSGGGTPKPVYEALGHMPIDWTKAWLFLIDERYIAADHANSNQRMIRETLLANASVPENHLCFPNPSLPLKQCIDDYTVRLKQQWSVHLPDLMILGMGPDGHIASLFPPLAGNLMDDMRLVAHTTTDAFAVHDRITLTMNPIAAASAHIFLLKGDDKKRLWDDMLKRPENERRWPAKRILEQPNVTVITGD
jgi:6-phosphogluconolactonase